MFVVHCVFKVAQMSSMVLRILRTAAQGPQYGRYTSKRRLSSPSDSPSVLPVPLCASLFQWQCIGTITAPGFNGGRVPDIHVRPAFWSQYRPLNQMKIVPKNSTEHLNAGFEELSSPIYLYLTSWGSQSWSYRLFTVFSSTVVEVVGDLSLDPVSVPIPSPRVKGIYVPGRR